MKFSCSCLLFILVASETISRNSENPPQVIEDPGNRNIVETTTTTTTTIRPVHNEAIKADVPVNNEQIPVETIEKININT
jgi:hypothetical protein